MTVCHREMVQPGVVAGQWWHCLDDGRVQCDVCPRECKLHEGQRGFSFVRQARDGGVVLTTCGRGVRLLHRSGREEAAEPLLSRDERFVVRDGGLQPRLPLLPELGHLKSPRD
jgi:hypothetical protein